MTPVDDCSRAHELKPLSIQRIKEKHNCVVQAKEYLLARGMLVKVVTAALSHGANPEDGGGSDTPIPHRRQR